MRAAGDCGPKRVGWCTFAVAAAAVAALLLQHAGYFNHEGLWQATDPGPAPDIGSASPRVQLEAEARAVQSAFCSRQAKSAGSIPPDSVKVRVEGLAAEGWDMLVYAHSDIVSQSILSSESVQWIEDGKDIGGGSASAGSWDAQRGQHFVEVTAEAAAKRNLSRSNAIFVDIGANVGWFTMLLAAHGFSVLAFEPLKQNVELLRRSLCLNPDLSERVTLFTEPLSAEERHGCTLYSDNGNVGDAHTTCEKPPNIPAGYSIRDPNVSSLTLERYLEGRRDVLLLKMDVEGHEGQVVKGALEFLTSGVVPYITMEFGIGTGSFVGGGLSGAEMLDAFAGHKGKYSLRGRSSFNEPPLAVNDLAAFATNDAGIYDIYLTSNQKFQK